MQARRATPTCYSKCLGPWDVDTVQQILPQGSKLGKLECCASRCNPVSQGVPKACESGLNRLASKFGASRGFADSQANRKPCESGLARLASFRDTLRAGILPPRTIMHFREFSSFFLFVWNFLVVRVEPVPLAWVGGDLRQAWSPLFPGCGPLCARQAWIPMGQTAFACKPKYFNLQLRIHVVGISAQVENCKIWQHRLFFSRDGD